MPSPLSPLVRRIVGSAAVLLGVLPLSSAVHPAHTRTDVASAGSVGRELTPEVRAAVRRQLRERGEGPYIAEMPAERDSALARWPDLKKPLKVWIQPTSDINEFRPEFTTEVRDAFRDWDSLLLPVRFAFTSDSAAADVHVTFIDHF